LPRQNLDYFVVKKEVNGGNRSGFSERQCSGDSLLALRNYVHEDARWESEESRICASQAGDGKLVHSTRDLQSRHQTGKSHILQ